MNTNTLRKTLEELEAEARPLDPARVLAGAKRRRRRRRALTGVASLGVASITVASFALADTIGNDQDAPAGQTIVAEPPLIADGTWYQLSKTRWIQINGTTWRLGDPPGTRQRSVAVGELDQPALDRGWVYPTSRTDGASWQALTFVRGDIRRAVVRIAGQRGEYQSPAQIYRIGSVPGWVLVVFVESPATFGAPYSNGAIGTSFAGFDAYDAAGRAVVRCDPPPYAPGTQTPVKVTCTTS